jgi:hypothetical protein
VFNEKKLCRNTEIICLIMFINNNIKIQKHGRGKEF